MSDAEKPFAATPNAIARAKRDGRLPRSAEVCTVCAFGAGLVAATFAVPAALAAASEAVLAAVRDPAAPLGRPLLQIVGWSGVPLAGAAAGAFLAALADGGMRLALPTFDARRLDPAAGLRRMFSREALLTGARAAAAFAVALGALATTASGTFAAALEHGSPSTLLALGGRVALRAAAIVCAVGAAFAVLDRWAARRRWLASLRMTHEELKRDLRESEGDPHAKGRRTAAHRALIRGSIARVREASFVVANPTHVAVALRYDPPAVPVPEILVRACDDGADRVKSIARACGIPVVEEVALARALFAQGEAGEPIPRSLYGAVAQVVAALVRERIVP